MTCRGFASVHFNEGRAAEGRRSQLRRLDQEAFATHVNVYSFCPTAQLLPHRSAFALPLSFFPTAQLLPHRSAFAPPLSFRPTAQLLPYRSAFAPPLSFCPTAQLLPYRSAFALPLSFFLCWNFRWQTLLKTPDPFSFKKTACRDSSHRQTGSWLWVLPFRFRYSPISNSLNGQHNKL